MSVNSINPTVVEMVLLLIFLVVFGLIFSMILSGIKGGGHNTGPTYGIGFGSHHPGGILLSDEERKVLKDGNIRREVIISY